MYIFPLFHFYNDNIQEDISSHKFLTFYKYIQDKLFHLKMKTNPKLYIIESMSYFDHKSSLLARIYQLKERKDILLNLNFFGYHLR